MYPSERSAEDHYEPLGSAEEKEADDQSLCSILKPMPKILMMMDRCQHASDYEKLRQKCNSMETSKKWLLREDKLYDFGLKCTREQQIFYLTYLNSFRPAIGFRREAMDQNFDRQKDFDRDRINTAYNLLREYEANGLKWKFGCYCTSGALLIMYLKVWKM
ncbi:hypothetical protein C1645_742277 [Glomus cerebriforme]|uniref:Uncharacterized protein n=1 Tax=Glomus cerebriforme TaxID=658196 RepID=A0A397SNR3_9GLOM|nr:hypothetical protein C1645_742277 [Glomus cerebriforme]